MLNLPPLTLILGVWLFFTSLCTRQMYHQFLTPLDIPIVDTLLSSPKEIAFLVSLSFNLKVREDSQSTKSHRVQLRAETSRRQRVHPLAPHLLRRNGPNCVLVSPLLRIWLFFLLQ